MKSTSQSNLRRRLSSRAINIGASGQNVQDHPERGGNLPLPSLCWRPRGCSTGQRSPLTSPPARSRTLEKARGSDRDRQKRGKEQGTRLPRGRHPSDASGEKIGDECAAGEAAASKSASRARRRSSWEEPFPAPVSARRAPNTALLVLPGSVRPYVRRRDSGRLSLPLSVRKEPDSGQVGRSGGAGHPGPCSYPPRPGRPTALAR